MVCLATCNGFWGHVAETWHDRSEPGSPAERVGALKLPPDLNLGDLHLLYQPVVDLRNGQIQLVESLLRWRQTTRGLDARNVLEVADRLGLLDEVESWILRRACASLAEACVREPWLARVAIAVNVEPSRLTCPKIVREVAAIMESTGLDPTRLVLEVTEHDLLEDSAVVRRQIAALRALGVRVALDDFGAGYSLDNLLRLHDLGRWSVDFVKIDRSFVQRGLHDPFFRSLIRTVVQLGEGSNIQVIAEGIECLEHEDLLTDLGCRLGQGFRIQRPGPLEQIAPVYKLG